MEKEGGLEHDSSSLIGKESTRTWRHGRWERERMDMTNLFSPCDGDGGNGKGGSILIDTQTGKEKTKSGYPLIHCFKEVHLIKIVMMKILRAWYNTASCQKYILSLSIWMKGQHLQGVACCWWRNSSHSSPTLELWLEIQTRCPILVAEIKTAVNESNMRRSLCFPARCSP